MNKENLNQEALRPVEIDYGIKKVKGIFHGWTQGKGETVEGAEYIYKAAIVEMEEDGKVIVVNPEDVQFMDRK